MHMERIAKKIMKKLENSYYQISKVIILIILIKERCYYNE